MFLLRYFILSCFLFFISGISVEEANLKPVHTDFGRLQKNRKYTFFIKKDQSFDWVLELPSNAYRWEPISIQGLVPIEFGEIDTIYEEGKQQPIFVQKCSYSLKVIEGKEVTILYKLKPFDENIEPKDWEQNKFSSIKVSFKIDN